VAAQSTAIKNSFSFEHHGVCQLLVPGPRGRKSLVIRVFP
jgi:hypothetical protein